MRKSKCINCSEYTPNKLQFQDISKKILFIFKKNRRTIVFQFQDNGFKQKCVLTLIYALIGSKLIIYRKIGDKKNEKSKNF